MTATAQGTATWLPVADRTFLPAIHGVRGLALALVVVYHLFGNGRVSGGVDVFLVISAFLITRSMRRTPLDHPARQVARRWARTFARLAPPALLTLAVVAVATPWVFAAPHTQSIFREVAASALYLENIELARTQAGYDAASVDTSPLQHFWSLSLQGQFFLLWPVALALVVWFARRTTARIRQIVVVALVATASALSFGYALYAVQVDQTQAYFSMGARLWEFGVGVLLALLPMRWHLRGPLATTASWVGVTVIVTSGFFIDGGVHFPGALTLVPVTATALILISALDDSRWSLGRALAARPLRTLADNSYGLYLWHWPLLIAYLTWQGQSDIDLVGAIVVVGVAYGLAVLTRTVADAATRWLRAPSRRTVTTLLVLALAVAAVAVPSAAKADSLERERQAQLDALVKPSTSLPGAAVLNNPELDLEAYTAPFRPSVEDAYFDLPPGIYERGCLQNWQDYPGMEEVLHCEDMNAPEEPSRLVVISGGSHIQQWYTAVDIIADANDWELIVIEKDGCRLQDPGTNFSGSSTCRTWNESAPAAILDREPDALITVGTETQPASPLESVWPSQITLWETVLDAGVPVIAFRDVPRFVEDVPTCVGTHDVTEGSTDDPCSVRAADVLAAENPLLTDPAVPDGVLPIDLTEYICPNFDMCPVIQGNVLMYRDDDHLTATYVRSLTPAVEQQLRQQAPFLFDN
ncbi:acyltransferase [Demequina sp. B12]|uniref:acyltransferase family protein n=1 Tax=Demequina sp. B12 TaxID=2992757 RepID=UPI00237B124A|nr:acyltransferase family protein [Demequina sp. B12]MDE0572522.1 acyltransferase [Demequina sp. B12]